MTPVPDYVEPVVGWRTWAIARTPQGVRLRSVIFGTVWQPRLELVAQCLSRPRRFFLRPWRRRPVHAGPYRDCGCGIYAASRLDRAGIYLEDRRSTPAWTTLNRVIGLVALWGDVIECDVGWRASRAYPVRVYVPSYAGRHGDASSVRRDLLVYGVPVEEVSCTHRLDLVAQLGELETGAVRPLR
jgi:hypothetical protein